MRTRITQTGTIDNTGDVQPDYLPLPDYTTFYLGILLPPPGEASHPRLAHSSAAQPLTSWPPAGLQSSAAQVVPPAEMYVGDLDPSPIVIISAAGSGSGSGTQAASGGTSTPG